ncbi:hypothetical protein SLEP1_g34148 [Rubroshorea leprosula]|uniref:Uncharacterized protein n=1 Tax=Rubroshorea leprosula TaxID=152421 RepID=A0AAV5KJ29_9ROSI|nr:hypothetical protein SLEP1_g34148 [Rubroshorea leprosula]
MAKSGQPDFFAGSEGGMNSQPYLNSPYPLTSSDPLLEMAFPSLSESELREVLLQGPIIMGTQCNSQQYGQPAGPSSGVMHDQHLTNINASRTDTPEMAPAKIVNLKKREADRAYRQRQRVGRLLMQNNLDRLSDENESLKRDNALMNETLQFQEKIIDQLKRDLTKLKSNNEMQSATGQHLAELLQLQDSTKFIKAGDEHHVKPTQDPTLPDEGSHLEKEISAGNLDGCDSKDENDSSKKKKRGAHSAPSECCSGKVPKYACYDARADRVVDPYSITECLRILKTMGDIPYPIVKKATAKFKSPDERETFIGLSADWKREWVKDLENDA